MAIIGWSLISIGMGLGLVGGIWLLIVAFKESIWWGLGSLFIPLVSAPVIFYLMLVWATVFGQMYRESKSMVAVQITPVAEVIEEL